METDTLQVVEIARDNDTFRKSGNGVMLTRGIQEFESVDGLMEAVREYDKFKEENDPYGEHDFGSLVWEGKKVFWKIDYYDQALRCWEDPKSILCRRVMTVMLAEEY